MNRFTVYGSQVFEDYLQNTLTLISNRFQESVDCKDLHALILGGGYGRGEGGVLKDGQEHLYNDLDFFVISKKLSYARTKQINKSLKFLHHELSEELKIDVDFADLKPISFLPRAPLTIMMYDLAMGHKVIWGKQNILKGLPSWDPRNLPHMEAFKLLLNRGMGLYFARQHLSGDSFLTETDFINRNIFKAYQAMGEAILIFEGKYHWSNLQRIEIMQKLALKHYTSYDEFLGLYLEAMNFKLKPWISKESKESLSLRLEQALCIYMEVYYRLWNDHFGINEINSTSQSDPYKAYIDRLSRTNLDEPGILKLAKNLALNFRDTKIKYPDLSLSSRYPRYRLFYALPWLIFGESCDLSVISHILGVPDTKDLKVLRERFVLLWQKYN